MGTVEHVVVTGLMGAGKTTIGGRLAARLGWQWRDSDADIEAATGQTVRMLRDRDGVEAMHALEKVQLIDALGSPGPNVISAAASVIEDPEARVAMTAPGVTVVWLHADPTVLAERFDSADEHRPDYGPSPAVFLAEQAAKREPMLGEVGAHLVDTAGLTPDEVVQRVVQRLDALH